MVALGGPEAPDELPEVVRVAAGDPDVVAGDEPRPFEAELGLATAGADRSAEPLGRAWPCPASLAPTEDCSVRSCWLCTRATRVASCPLTSARVVWRSAYALAAAA